MIEKGKAVKATAFMRQSADHMTGATGKSLTTYISKNGGAFSGVSRSVSEVGYGFYSVQLTAADCDTLDDLMLRCVAAGCDDEVVIMFVSDQPTQAEETWALAGLDPARVLEVSSNERKAGSGIIQTIVSDSIKTTVTRT